MHTNNMKDTKNNFNISLLCDQKEKLIQAIKKIKHEIDECHEAEKDTFVEALEVENRFEEIEREIQTEFRNLHRFLDEEEEMDLERLRKERDKRMKILKEREKKIAMQGRDLERAIETLNCKLREDDSPKLLKEIKELLKRCEVNFICPAPVESDICSSQFVGPIQYRIWKHMKTSLYPNISALTFDPETAHPLLTLSADRTTVFIEEDKEVPEENPAERNPKRFHYYYCVMGSEGFTHGCHYWEVEVKGKTSWRVGVARADVHRGEMTSSSTLNGLWTLSLKNGLITACTHPKPTQVRSSTHLIRIGIFLDCEKEEVSFHNAVTMMPLFSFYMGTVLVPLYPFYNPCDTDEGKNCAPLSIFHPSF
ncbi:zinc-binding protein A33-like isoform X1 [Xyrauchen texanus]|uniref:zinc-binding protein A33-like isoform X1 n=1 Tax=Xyrauchen texanus TaxID=154827 RepID=UPI002241C1E7|nr:zinc-binding protein A33-like isoform X1 [Xyrauchen texanus]XP_052003240.1 zinc-binding protein A33-like isoform X1 [Xyrauchen texanus]